MLQDITPIILTYNEAPNIQRTLSALQWARRIVVVDSYSDDATHAICAQFEHVDFIQREFEQHAEQWNFAIKQNITSGWILALDADHVISEELIEELTHLKPKSETNGYWASFIYKINGQALRGSLYPPLISLYRNKRGQYHQDGHTQRVNVAGDLESLNSQIYHDDRKSKQRWVTSQKKYAAQEAQKLSSSQWNDLTWADRLRVIGIAPLVVLPYTLFVKGLAVNGLAGWHYAWQRFLAEIYLQIARIDL